LIISFLILVSVSGAGKFTQCMRLQNELAVKISATNSSNLVMKIYLNSSPYKKD